MRLADDVTVVPEIKDNEGRPGQGQAQPCQSLGFSREQLGRAWHLGFSRVPESAVFGKGVGTLAFEGRPIALG